MKFDTNTEYLLTCVLQNRTEEVIHIVRSQNFDRQVLTDIGCFEHPFSLYKLTLCNVILTNTDMGWKEPYQSLMAQHNEYGQKLLQFWKDEFGFPIESGMDFENYPECAHFIDWDIEDLLDGNLYELEAMGYDRDEAELCYAVLTYQVPLLLKHLKHGTNPNVYVSGLIEPKKASIRDGESYNALAKCIEIPMDIFEYYGLGAVFWGKGIPTVTPILMKYVLEAAAYIQLEQLFRSRLAPELLNITV